MKKTLAILLALTMLFDFAACGSKQEDTQGEKTLIGEWHLYDEGATAAKETYTFNEDGTGLHTSIENARKENHSFTYADKDGILTLTFENGRINAFRYTLEVDKLIINGDTFVRPLTAEGK